MFTYIASALFGISTGTSLGTVFTMGPVLFPASVAMGVDPAIAAGPLVTTACDVLGVSVYLLVAILVIT